MGPRMVTKKMIIMPASTYSPNISGGRRGCKTIVIYPVINAEHITMSSLSALPAMISSTFADSLALPRSKLKHSLHVAAAFSTQKDIVGQLELNKLRYSPPTLNGNPEGKFSLYALICSPPSLSALTSLVEITL
ncbi:hypothetical protein Hypma_009199 [Hypsizygus marmoreus]|uniref:Uncharacterized protein n=1 Tax=Hypsizygus marmoreus TaxID=39966 RepID=A0A369JPL2_HYPMA|nr:hypothetical protein Hypma_009199 [Hypsizygus marmoreus]